MHKKPGGVRTAGIVIAAALLVVCVLVAAFLTTIKGGRRSDITLPDPSAQPEHGAEPAPAEDLFVSVDKENIRAVLDTMARPEAYHQVLTVTNLWDGGSISRTVELWNSGTLARAQITEQGRTRNLLTDGRTVWIWYDGDRTAAALEPDASVSFDDLTGIPTYETLASLPPKDILEAGFVTLDEPDGRSCLYISARDGDYEDRYWVDVRTQLLCRADSLTGDAQTYQLLQTSWEVVTAEDTTLQNVFRLPDGTAVAATAE